MNSHNKARILDRTLTKYTLPCLKPITFKLLVNYTQLVNIPELISVKINSKLQPVSYRYRSFFGTAPKILVVLAGT